jgi:hypothetical protein
VKNKNTGQNNNIAPNIIVVNSEELKIVIILPQNATTKSVISLKWRNIPDSWFLNVVFNVWNRDNHQK